MEAAHTMAAGREEYFSAIRQHPPMPDCVFEKKIIVNKTSHMTELLVAFDNDGVTTEEEFEYDNVVTDKEFDTG
jgi:hypothetical protein